jgi:uncharacterized protein (TIGR03435 family)
MSRAFLLLLTAAASFAQSAPSTFEVASVKLAPPISPELVRSGNFHLGVKIDQSRADFGGVSLPDLIARAYGVRTFQISGPDWINANRFDVLAKLPQGASPDQVPEMLQSLLADRFQLKLRRETKEFPVFALTTAKAGPKLEPRPADWDPSSNSTTRPVSMEKYSQMISDAVDRPVLDQTSLKGEYMVSVDAVVRSLMARHRSATTAPTDAAVDPMDSDLFRAIQAMGLRLEPCKVALPYLVIENLAQTPTAN